jgi:hypothetical protein
MVLAFLDAWPDGLLKWLLLLNAAMQQTNFRLLVWYFQ